MSSLSCAIARPVRRAMSPPAASPTSSDSRKTGASTAALPVASTARSAGLMATHATAARGRSPASTGRTSSIEIAVAATLEAIDLADLDTETIKGGDGLRRPRRRRENLTGGRHDHRRDHTRLAQHRLDRGRHRRTLFELAPRFGDDPVHDGFPVVEGDVSSWVSCHQRTGRAGEEDERRQRGGDEHASEWRTSCGRFAPSRPLSSPSRRRRVAAATAAPPLPRRPRHPQPPPGQPAVSPRRQGPERWRRRHRRTEGAFSAWHVQACPIRVRRRPRRPAGRQGPSMTDVRSSVASTAGRDGHVLRQRDREVRDPYGVGGRQHRLLDPHTIHEDPVLTLEIAHDDAGRGHGECACRRDS